MLWAFETNKIDLRRSIPIRLLETPAGALGLQERYHLEPTAGYILGHLQMKASTVGQSSVTLRHILFGHLWMCRMCSPTSPSYQTRVRSARYSNVYFRELSGEQRFRLPWWWR